MGRPRTKRDLSLSCLKQTRVTPEAGKRFDALAISKGVASATYLRILIMNALDAAAASAKKGD